MNQSITNISKEETAFLPTVVLSRSGASSVKVSDLPVNPGSL